jgi:hypothetical protein
MTNLFAQRGGASPGAGEAKAASAPSAADGERDPRRSDS